MDQDIHVWWANGQEWVVNGENDRYFYSQETEGEPWNAGTPPRNFSERYG
jgi:hypothetical protein